MISGNFWSERYSAEGMVWGEGHSPTAALAIQHFPAACRVLEVGLGYGRDLLFLAKQGFRVSGVDPSIEGIKMVEKLLQANGQQSEKLFPTTLEKADLPSSSFDAILSHRTLHLLTSAQAIEQFVEKLAKITKPNAVLCIAARDLRDLDLTQMQAREPGIYEYRERPGHLVSYWDEKRFEHVFKTAFEIISFQEAIEQESENNPVPCYLTIMLARKREV